MPEDQRPGLGDEAPGWKNIVIVIMIIVMLIGFSWVAWYKFGWFHSPPH